jgi:ligand-binding sensor domain-containing protein
MIVGRLTVAALVGLCLAAATVESQEILPQHVLGRYQQFLWQDRHGLPQNTITGIVRARDGYLWLGTIEGAVRFDGVRFTVFDNSNTPESRSNWITDLVEDRRGNLWFGTSEGGLVRLIDGVFTRYGKDDGLPDDRVMTLLEDRAGVLWIGTHRGGLSRYHDGRFTTYAAKDGLPAGIVWALAEDGEGVVWIGTGSGLAAFDGTRFTRYTVRDGLADDDVRALCWDKDGRLWIGTGRGLTWLHDGAFEPAGSDPPIRDRIAAIFQDREGSIWVGTRASGLYRFTGTGAANYRGKDGLPGDDVETIYQDPEGISGLA